jgi:hypothetical protein
MNLPTIMKATLLLLAALLLAPLAATHAADKQPTKPRFSLKLDSERDITSLTTGGPGHAATLVQTTSRAILAAWWSGV